MPRRSYGTSHVSWEPVHESLRDEANEVWPDARPQARDNPRRSHCITSRIVSGREQSRWSQIGCRSRRVFMDGLPGMEGMSRLLVCPPDFFRIDYEINPWMSRSNVVEPEQAIRQWHGLMEVLEDEIGAVLERIAPVSRTAARGGLFREVVSRSRIRHRDPGP